MHLIGGLIKYFLSQRLQSSIAIRYFHWLYIKTQLTSETWRQKKVTK